MRSGEPCSTRSVAVWRAPVLQHEHIAAARARSTRASRGRRGRRDRGAWVYPRSSASQSASPPRCCTRCIACFHPPPPHLSRLVPCGQSARLGALLPNGASAPGETQHAKASGMGAKWKIALNPSRSARAKFFSLALQPRPQWPCSSASARRRCPSGRRVGRRIQAGPSQPNRHQCAVSAASHGCGACLRFSAAGSRCGCAS